MITVFHVISTIHGCCPVLKRRVVQRYSFDISVEREPQGSPDDFPRVAVQLDAGT